jgi:serine/threonine-protein kinase RsbW
MNTGYSLCLAAELKNLAVIRGFVQESAAALDVAPAIISDLLLAVDEAVANVIIHGYQGQQGTIEIEVKREAMEVAVHVRDNAPPFDPTDVPSPDLTRPLGERPPGGLGIHLIRQYIDKAIHRLTPQGGNELVLKKSIETAIRRRKQ